MMRRTATLFLSAALLSACNGASEDGSEVTSKEVLMKFNVNKYSMNKVVCDPLDGGGSTDSPEQGIKAELYYSHTGYGNVDAYIDNGTKVDSDLFFSNMYVPTRVFSLGFPTETGNLLLDNNENVLVENFALRMETTLRLGPDQAPGFYEFAVLADDGTVVNYRDTDGLMKTLIDNDGNHPTRMGCSGSVTRYFDENTRLPIEIKYYQGPRYHIAIVPLMRRIDDQDGQMAETQCGKKGNNMYFAYNNNSEPQSAYLNLLLRGWEPLNSSNYLITNDNPDVDVDFNPCTDALAPTIVDLLIEGDPIDSGISAFWRTDILAASQLLITNVDTGVESLIESDNVARSTHSFFVTVPSGTYDVRAISVSEALGRTVSEPVRLEL